MQSTLERPHAIKAPKTPARAYLWPESEFYVSERHRLVYCPIQKIACSSLKLWWAELVDGSSNQFVGPGATGKPKIDHGALNARYKLHHQPAELGQRPLTDDGWLRVVFVRNPWARLVSAFVNKFVHLNELARSVLKEVDRQQRHKTMWRLPSDAIRLILRCGRSGLGLVRRRRSFWNREAVAWHDELTFRHFVDYLAASDLDRGQIDPHWSPQYRFQGKTRFNFVGRFEHLHEDVHELTRLLDVDIALPATNRTTYTPIYRRNFADCSLKQLRKLPSIPDYRRFYTSELRDQVARLYRTDINKFGYRFED